MTEKRKGKVEVREIGGNVLMTVRAPRDGAGRETSTADLNVLFTPSEWATFTNECVFLNAGLKR